MPLFSTRTRTDARPRQYAEPSFDFLDRSSRPEFDRVRQLCNEWYTRLPDPNEDLLARFQSPDELQHLGAVFELFGHEMFFRLGYVIELHPKTGSGKTGRPDFLVRDPSGVEFYAETAVASGKSKEELAADARKNVVLDFIQGVKCPDFYLLLKANGDPKTPPSGKRLRCELEKWLTTLDVGKVSEAAAPSLNALPRFAWNHENWSVEFRAIPRSPSRRGDPNVRVIGALFHGAHFVDSWTPIRDTVTKKGGKYGKLDKPLLVIVNSPDFALDRIDEMQALYGQEQFIFDRSEPSKEPEMSRGPNGVWHGPKGPQYTRVSAVMIARDIQPTGFARRSVTTYLNPWAALPISGPILKLPIAEPRADSKMEWRAGMTLAELFGLSSNWPETPVDGSVGS